MPIYMRTLLPLVAISTKLEERCGPFRNDQLREAGILRISTGASKKYSANGGNCDRSNSYAECDLWWASNKTYTVLLKGFHPKSTSHTKKHRTCGELLLSYHRTPKSTIS